MNLQWVHEPLHSPFNVGEVAFLTNVARFAHLSFSTGVSARNHDFGTEIMKTPDFRAAFKFGRRVHFSLRRQMLKLPIARLPAILLYFINRPSGETDAFMKQVSSDLRRRPN